ncbi:porin [Pseudohoeflea suaedae]|uniref:Porin n=1 Tax=Pseudohoeflea suaedae TaxID=877384 RepID=A0A4R5PJI8_9HYPH|nr:porin [Pseudohoeflea suaedae]TDH35837.1 porin [Pseudohoeflea suaedae]
MKIKSLLLGSAAALVAVSGARAADAIIVAEPEPVEYVRVCDAFGTGFFYIPGTETCLRIHGYVRFDVFGGDLFARTSLVDETYNVNSRLSLRTSTASETELGTLRTYTETRFNFNTSDVSFFGTDIGYTNDTTVSLNFAWIQLGGLRVGKDESFFTTWTGYAGAVINDTPLGGYGPFDTNLISYTYNGGAFRAGIALEQGVDNTAVFNFATGDIEPSGWGIDDYMPHVVVGLGATFGMVDLSAVAAWDSRDDLLLFGNLFERGGWAGKIRADVAFNDAFSVFAMLMYGENSSAYTTWSNGVADDETFAVVGGFSYAFSEKASLNTQIDWVDGGAGVDDAWALTANVAYELVPGLVITPEIQYVDAGDDAEDFGAGIRVQRSF